MTALKPGERRTCPTCGEDFVGALNLVDPRMDGADIAGPPSVMQVTLAPDTESGNVLIQQVDGVLRAIVFGQTDTVDWLRQRGVQLRALHIGDCTDPNRFRRTPTRPEGLTA